MLYPCRARGAADDLIVVKGIPQLIGKLAADLPAAAAVFPADGDHKAGAAFPDVLGLLLPPVTEEHARQEVQHPAENAGDLGLIGAVVLGQIFQHLGLADGQPGILQVGRQFFVHQSLVCYQHVVKCSFHGRQLLFKMLES